jgi:Spy/CpxP family protein refolding chaperone
MMRRMHKTATTLAAIGAISFGAMSAQAQDHDPEKWAKEFEQKMLERTAKTLGLTEEQKAKYLELHTANAEAQQKAEKELEAKLEALLTEEQKTKRAEMKKNPMAGLDLGKDLGGLTEKLGNLGKMFGGGGKNPLRDAEALATELGLDGDKAAKLAEVYAKYAEESKSDSTEQPDWSDPQAAMKQMQEQRKKRSEARKKRNERIRDLLRGEKREQFDALEKKHGNSGMVQSFGLSLGGPGGPMVFGSGEGGPTPMPFGGGSKGGPAVTRSHRSDTASTDVVKKDLQLSEEEEMVLWPIVEKILKAKRAHENWRRGSTRALRRALKDDSPELGAKLTELRDRDRALKDELTGLRGELRDLVTLAQEAVLVGYGVLE